VLPLAFKCENKRILVLGAGDVAAQKIRVLRDAGAVIEVITKDVLVAIPEGVTVQNRAYQEGDLTGYHLVISAIGVPEINDLIVREARAAGIWLNVVDDPGRSDFYFTAVHREGDVMISVSSQGSAPAVAQVVREVVVAALPKGLALVAKEIRAERDALHEAGETSEGRAWKPRILELLDQYSEDLSTTGAP
jgi:siroheme synthase-like protein